MKKLFLFCLAFLICLSGHDAWAYTREDCAKCHEKGSTDSTLTLSIEEFEASIHGREITCQDCHTGVKDEDHQTKKGYGTVDCSQCHDQQNRHALHSKSENRPHCYSCHTKHGILEKDNASSSVYPERLKETCRGCHAFECGEVDYLSWLPSLQIASHRKQDFSQAYERTNCIGCHQGLAAHGEEGQLNDHDCYKCHLPKKGQAGLWGYIHPRADYDKQPGVFAAATIYQFFAVVLLWGAFGFYIKRFSGRNKRARK